MDSYPIIVCKVCVFTNKNGTQLPLWVYRSNLMKAKEQPAGASLGSATPPSQSMSATPIRLPQSTATGNYDSSMQQREHATNQQHEEAQPIENGNGYSRDQNEASTGLHCSPVNNAIQISIPTTNLWSSAHSQAKYLPVYHYSARLS